MSRAATTLIVLAMAVTALSVAVVLALQFGVPAGQAATIGIALLLALALLHVQTERRRDRRWMETRIGEISAVAGDVNTEVGKVATRIARLDKDLAARVHDESEPLAAEVEVLGQIVKQVADTLADLEHRLERRIEEVSARAEALRIAPPDVQHVPPPPPPAPSRDVARPALADPGLFVQAEPAERPEAARLPSAFEREVEAAIRGERIEIHLQPIVTLPQRKVRYYEVLSRLRGNDGRLIPGAEFIPAAEARRVIQKLDTYQVIRSFQILKRLTARNREIGLTVNLSPASLADTVFFREFNAFLGQNRSVADLVQFEFTQAAVRDMGPLEIESLRAVAGLGYRFSVDNVTDLRMDFRDLADQGFRTVKVSAATLLGRNGATGGDIHPADLAGHLNRMGLMLVVDRIEAESEVIDLLDFEVRFAQGFLFSAPRQVRPEILGAAAAAAPTAPAASAPAARAAGRGA